MVNVEVAVSSLGRGGGVTLVGSDNVVAMVNDEIDRLVKRYKK